MPLLSLPLIALISLIVSQSSSAGRPFGKAPGMVATGGRRPGKPRAA